MQICKHIFLDEFACKFQANQMCMQFRQHFFDQICVHANLKKKCKFACTINGKQIQNCMHIRNIFSTNLRPLAEKKKLFCANISVQEVGKSEMFGPGALETCDFGCQTSLAFLIDAPEGNGREGGLGAQPPARTFFAGLHRAGNFAA